MGTTVAVVQIEGSSDVRQALLIMCRRKEWAMGWRCRRKGSEIRSGPGAPLRREELYSDAEKEELYGRKEEAGVWKDGTVVEERVRWNSGGVTGGV